MVSGREIFFSNEWLYLASLHHIDKLYWNRVYWHISPHPFLFSSHQNFFQIHIQIIELRRSWFPTCFGIMYKFNRIITHTHTHRTDFQLRCYGLGTKKTRKKSLILHKIKSNVKSNSFKYQYFMSDSAVQIENLLSLAL